jgi:hypothetical protein
MRELAAPEVSITSLFTRAARVDSQSGSWFARGLTLTVPSPAVYARAAEALV